MTNLTKQEINSRIAELVFPDAEVMRAGNKSFVFIEYNGRLENTVDYYNNWNDLMPLVVEHGVTYVETSGNRKPYYVALHRSAINSESETKDLSEDSLKCALALCLLKVLEAKEKE